MVQFSGHKSTTIMAVMHSLVSDQVSPICLNKSFAQFPIELATVCGSSTSIRQKATVKLTDLISVQAIVVKNLHIQNQMMTVPKQWSKYIPQWSQQLTDCSYTPVQILIGSDKSTIHPVDVMGEDGEPIETDSCRLKRSKITNKYLTHGYNYNLNVKYTHNTDTVKG